MVTSIPNSDYDISAYELVPVAPTRLLQDGDVIDLGDRRLTVLHLPGHTPGSIALHDNANRILFTGDVIYDPPSLLDDLHGSDRTAYVHSMRRILALDVVCVYSGHGDSFDGDPLRVLAQDYIDAVGGNWDLRVQASPPADVVRPQAERRARLAINRDRCGRSRGGRER